MQQDGEPRGPSAAGPSAAGMKLTGADASAVFDQLGRSGLIERGGVNIIGLDTVRERLAQRWERKRDVVWEHLDASARRRLGPSDLCLRLNETDFAVACAEAGPAAAQATALQILAEVLEHFLGECRTEELVIRAVTAFEGGEIACTTLDPRTIRREVADADGKVCTHRERRRFNEQPFILTSMGGRELRLRHEFEPVISLRTRRPIATTLEPAVFDVASGRRIPGWAFGKLSDLDLYAIDGMTLELAEQAMIDGHPPAPLLLPLSYQTLSGSRGRGRLVELLSGQGRPRVAAAITNIEPGTPPSWLGELVSMLRRMDVTVFLRLPPQRDVFSALGDSRPNGLILDVESLGARPEKIPPQLGAFAARASAVAPIMAVRGLSGEDLLNRARALGFTHASVDEAAGLTLAA